MDDMPENRFRGWSEHVWAAPELSVSRPSRAMAEAAVRTLIAYIGEDPEREGLLSTPKRIVDAYDEIYQGYRACPADVLDRTFEERAGYQEFVLVKDIRFNSHCEHHMMPFFGRAHVAYMPTGRIVGLSKLARVVDAYALRLQSQENLTSQIATAIHEVLRPSGVAVMVQAEHMCMSIRGISKPGTLTDTTCFLGQFQRADEQRRFLRLLGC